MSHPVERVWSPGLEASPRVVHRAISVPRQPRSATRFDEVVGGAMVVVVVVLAAFAGWTIRPPTPGPVSEVLPPAGTARWQVELPGQLLPGSLDADPSSVALAAGGELVVLDVSSGAPRWGRALARAGSPHVRIFGSTLVVLIRSDELVWAAGYDLATGGLRWERERADVDSWLLGQGLVEYIAGSDHVAMRIVDPANGGVIGAATVGADVATPPGWEVGWSLGTFVLFDIETGRIRSPAVVELDLAAVAPVGDHVVGLTPDDELILFDHQGLPIDRLSVADALGPAGPARALVGIDGDASGIAVGNGSIGFDVVDGQIEPAWTTSSHLVPPVATEIGPISIAHSVNPLTSVLDVELVDVHTGATVVVTDLGVTRLTDPIVLHDGYVLAPVVGDRDRVISGVGFDGEVRWSVATPAGSWYLVGGGTLFLFDPGANTLAAHR